MKKYTQLYVTIFVLVCYYPQGLQIMGSEFSTGTSDSPGYMVELSGMYNGNYTTFTDYILSAGKIFGMGRITAPTKITFKPADTNKLSCK